MLTIREALLVKFMEECTEAAKEASKCIHFTPYHTGPGRLVSNSQNLEQEIIDVLGLIEMLQDEGLVRKDIQKDFGAIRQRKLKVLKYFKISQDLGTLDFTEVEFNKLAARV